MTHYRISSRVTSLPDGRFVVFVTATPLGNATEDPMTERRECSSSAQAEVSRQELSRHLAECVAGAGGRIVSVEIA
ncbi:MAG: hypothetical protein ACXWG1_12900 [Usitatibacter sp.]